MKFAIVFFTEEKDSVGLIPTNWLIENNTICLYPAKKKEGEKNLLVRTRAPPKSNWSRCPIKLYKCYTSYDAASAHVTDAENTSHLDTDTEETGCIFPANRIRLDTDESSEDENSNSLIVPTYPSPPSTQKSLKRTSTDSLSLTQVEKYIKKPKRTLPVVSASSSSEPTIQSNIEAISRLQKSLEEIIERQKVQEELLKELNSSIQKLEGKAISALSSKDSLEMPLETELVQLLPVSSSDFGSFGEKIKSCGALRLQIKKILLGCYGRDSRGLVNSCMRRILADDIGLTYSLTGRNKHGGNKLSFEGTAVYHLIREVCLQTFSGEKENVVRDAVSDWLLQAKFRIARRAKTSVNM